jgi:hypothetical protein
MLSLRLARCTGTTTSVSLTGELPTPQTIEARRLVRNLVRLLGTMEKLHVAVSVDERSSEWCDDWGRALVGCGERVLEVRFELADEAAP